MNKNMRLLGIIGGMSWESTHLYYKLINENIKTRLGGLHSAELLLRSVDFNPIAEMQKADRWNEIGRLMAVWANELKAGGAEAILITSNTLHLFAEDIEKATGLPVLHIADVTGEAIAATPHKKLVLLGTAFTMDMPFYREKLETYGLDVFVPSGEDRAIVHTVIYDELCKGAICEESRSKFLTILGKAREQGATAAILGCTEIGLLVQQSDTEMTLFDTTILHSQAAAAWITRV